MLVPLLARGGRVIVVPIADHLEVHIIPLGLLHLLVLLTVMLELCTVLAWSLEFLYVVVEFIKE